MAERRFLLLVFVSIAALALVSGLHVWLTPAGLAERHESPLDELIRLPPAVRAPAAQQRPARPGQPGLWARLAHWSEELDDSVAVARANFRSGPFGAGLGAREKARSGDHGAIEELARARKAAPGNVELIRAHAAALARAGRLSEARAAYTDLVRRAPDGATDRFNYGVCLVRLDQLSEAADQLERVLELQPQFDRAVYNLAVVRQQQGKLSEAIALWRRFCGRQPDVSSAWFNLAVAENDLGHHAEALEGFEHADRLQSGDPVTLYNIGVTLRALGRHAEAERPLARAAELDPADETTRVELESLRAVMAGPPQP